MACTSNGLVRNNKNGLKMQNKKQNKAPIGISPHLHCICSPWLQSSPVFTSNLKHRHGLNNYLCALDSQISLSGPDSISLGAADLVCNCQLDTPQLPQTQIFTFFDNMCLLLHCLSWLMMHLSVRLEMWESS